MDNARHPSRYIYQRRAHIQRGRDSDKRLGPTPVRVGKVATGKKRLHGERSNHGRDGLVHAPNKARSKVHYMGRLKFLLPESITSRMNYHIRYKGIKKNWIKELNARFQIQREKGQGTGTHGQREWTKTICEEVT